ncbi:MAG: hypothetical protein H6774_02910 [Pseudomonadales bacterium]|nr:hypothetical protein [Candidatus Woesebacteria bacterium]MCB9802016.1 hypothetical protein [Pseudomonadales bacterium]
MDALSELTQLIFSPNSVWSVVARGAIWFVIAIAIVVMTDTADPYSSTNNFKSNLGLFLLFIVMGSGLVYFLFGYTA